MWFLRGLSASKRTWEEKDFSGVLLHMRTFAEIDVSLLYAFESCRNMPPGAQFFKSGNSAKMLLLCRFGFSEAEKPRALHLQATPFSLEVRWVG